MIRAALPLPLRAPGTPRHRLTAWLAAPLLAGALLVGSAGTGSAEPLPDPSLLPDASQLLAPDGAGSTSALPDGEVPPTPEALLPVPTAEELAAQAAEAERLASEVVNQEEALAEARVAIDTVSQQATAALEAEQAALDDRAAALVEQLEQLERLEAATALVRSRQGELGRWASQTYRDGAQLSGIEGLMTLLDSENTDDLSQRVATLDRVGRWRGSVVDTVEEAEQVQADASARAQAAAVAATTAAGEAVAAREEADALLVQQRAQVALLQALLTSTEQAAVEAGDVTEAMAAARAEAEQRRLAAMSGSRLGNAVTGAVGECTGGDVTGYPNGAIPVENLCPLWATRGQSLRADAAFAFNQMSEAFALELGQPICVTDSYRDFAGQVAVYATKPQLAARPGTSNHGWGTATDLCGGIQGFGTPQHLWMRTNAPLYGFFHPSWAQQGGSRPEPWHWEYGG